LRAFNPSRAFKVHRPRSIGASTRVVIDVGNHRTRDGVVGYDITMHMVGVVVGYDDALLGRVSQRGVYR
jgi:actin-related protein